MSKYKKDQNQANSLSIGTLQALKYELVSELLHQILLSKLNIFRKKVLSKEI